MLKIGVMGIRGYTGEELLRILLQHPKVQVCCLQARVERPQPLSKVLPRFLKKTDLVCADYSPEVMAKGCDVVFLALPHTVSMDVAPKILKRGKKVIDLSADFRLEDTAVYSKYYRTEHKAGSAPGSMPSYLPRWQTSSATRNSTLWCA